jgi:hypothetical protein
MNGGKKMNNHKMVLMIILMIIIVLMLFTEVQAGTGAGDVVKLPALESPPVIDGVLDDPAWEHALSFTDFKTIKPDVGQSPSQKTVVYAAYDMENLYFAFHCLDSAPDKIKAAVCKRDANFDGDWAAVALDTFNNRLGGIAVGVNPLGIQGDGTIDVNADFDATYDLVFRSAGKINGDGYCVEIAIPFKSLRYPNQKRIIMSFKAARNIHRNSEEADFPEYNPGKGSALSQFQKIEISGIKYRRTVEILPAVTASRGYSHRDGELLSEGTHREISLTGKLGLTSNLTLDATYNPDFSQVETDAGQIDVNLRSSLYYPEKRSFFLEGRDLFGVGASPEDTPLEELVHTRTIVDPRLGFKITGKVGNKNIVALLYAVDEYPGAAAEREGNTDLAGKNAVFSILRYARTLKYDGYIGGFYTGREFGAGHNRVLGIDGRFRLDNFSTLEYHALKSFTRELADSSRGSGENDVPTLAGDALGLSYRYHSRNLYIQGGMNYVSPNFKTEVGYLTRTGVLMLPTEIAYMHYPKSGVLQMISPLYWGRHTLDINSNLVESYNLLAIRFFMPRQTELRIDGFFGNEVFAGQRFNRGALGIQGQSQLIKQLALTFSFRRGKYIYYDPQAPFQGKGTRAAVGLVFQPTVKINSQFDISYADFFRGADNKKVYDYTILRNRTTFQFNRNLFVRGIVEYNTYWKRMNIDFLASFTYIPGTVLYLGYGSVYEKLGWNGREYVPADEYLQTRRSFFFKASYLWRL